jgi:hypothetical protein
MKKALIFITCVLLGFTSCQKSENIVPTNTITATIDGVNESFNIKPTAYLTNSLKVNADLAIFGTNSTVTNADYVSITLTLNQTVTPGTYMSGNSTAGVQILYNQGSTNPLNLDYYDTPLTGSQSTIVITALSNTAVQGTFSGILTNASDGTTKTVTNGKFSLALN